MKNKKNIVITGGNRGIGFGLLENLSQGHNVIFTARDQKIAEDTLDKIENSGHNINYVTMDVNELKSVMNAGDQISRICNSVDLLFNNAGILLNEYALPALETSEDSILETFNTNTLGVLRVCKVIVPLMKNGGSILTLTY